MEPKKLKFSKTVSEESFLANVKKNYLKTFESFTKIFLAPKNSNFPFCAKKIDIFTKIILAPKNSNF
jgi:hypothetical protein